MNNLTPEEIEFLKQSNFIEGVYDGLPEAILAWNYIKRKSFLTRKSILRTHKILMKGRLENKDLGKFRTRPVFVSGEEGLKHSRIEDDISRWIKVVNRSHYLIGQPESTIDYFTKGSHIWYEKIHPFIDGNGRTGRIFMNWQRIQAGVPILIIKESEKQQYYKWFQ